MARVDVPDGYNSWNEYIEAQADASVDQSRTARMLVKRDIKLGEIASVQRTASHNQDSPSYRIYQNYTSPGTANTVIGHPWTATYLTTESGNGLITEDGDSFVI